MILARAQDELKMSAQAAKLMGNSFYGKMMEDLDCLSENVQECIKGMRNTFNEAIRNNPWVLRYVPDFLKTKEICIRAIDKNPWQLKDVPHNFKTQEIYDKAVRGDPHSLSFIPDHFKTQEMCNRVVEASPYALRYIPDCLLPKKCVTTQQYFFLFLTFLKQKKCVSKPFK